MTVLEDPIPRATCVCGWPRPLFAITTSTGAVPNQPLVVSYDCPACGRFHRCGEVTEQAQASPRARSLAEQAQPPLTIPLRQVVDPDYDDDDGEDEFGNPFYGDEEGD